MSSRVLVVDDDPLTLRTIRRVLERAGHRARVLDGGFGFAMALREFDPDAVLLDVSMPGLDGGAALKSARELRLLDEARPRIILHSGRSETDLAALCEAIGAHAYLRKPAPNAEILAVIEPPADGAS